MVGGRGFWGKGKNQRVACKNRNNEKNKNIANQFRRKNQKWLAKREKAGRKTQFDFKQEQIR